MLAAIGGIALLARSGVSSTFAGRGLEFDVLAAIVLGGTTFEGGTGGVGGTVAGMLVLFVAFNMVNMAGLNYNSQLLIKGVIIIMSSAGYAYLNEEDDCFTRWITKYVADEIQYQPIEDQPTEDQQWRKQQ